MAKVKIVMVCGLGLGSSFACQMTTEEVLNKFNVDASLDHANISDAPSLQADIIMTAENFRKQFDKFTMSESTTLVYLKNIVSKKEIEEKLLPVLKEKNFI